MSFTADEIRVIWQNAASSSVIEKVRVLLSIREDRVDEDYVMLLLLGAVTDRMDELRKGKLHVGIPCGFG